MFSDDMIIWISEKNNPNQQKPLEKRMNSPLEMVQSGQKPIIWKLIQQKLYQFSLKHQNRTFNQTYWYHHG